MPGRSDGRAVVRAGGTVLWRRDGQGCVLVGVVHRPRYDDWSLPKGKCEPTETLPACAVRETDEETGFRPVLGRRVADVGYTVGQPPQRKTITYFAGRAEQGAFRPNHEVDELRWCTPAEATKLLSYPDDHATLAGFAALPADTATLLLVRHAKAGSRSNWAGDDDLRPLSTAGRRQERALRELLPLFGPRWVHAAPRVRCEQTVAGLAEQLGVPLVSEPLLTEEAYQAAPAAATRRLVDLVRPSAATAVCSQGGAIPGMIGRLAEESGLDLGTKPLPCKKGSVWVLSFTPDAPHRLLAADYLASPLAPPKTA
jgi:8-oxo-dGTP diphosphatase